MAGINDIKAKRKAMQEGSTSEVETVENTEVVEETNTGIEDELNSLLNQATEQLENIDVDAQAGATNLFDPVNGTGASTDGGELTPEEMAKNAERDARKLEREREIADYNLAIESAMSQLKAKSGDKEISDKQKAFQKACSSFFVCDGLVVETSAVPEVSIGRKYLTVDGQPKLQPGVTQEMWQSFINKTNTTLKRGNLQDYASTLRYNYKRPGKLIGGVITIPANLNITVDAFNNEEFNLPTATDIKAADKITTVINFDTLYTYALLYCGGEMKEHESLKEGKFIGAKLGGKLRAEIAIGTENNNGRKTTVEKRIFKATNRSQLFVQENIIPVKSFATTTLAKIKSEPATMAAITELMKSGLAKKKNENVATATKLNSVSQTLFDYVLDETGDVGKVTCKFLTGAATLGQGAHKALALSHWSNAKVNEQGKRQAEILADNPIALYSQSPKKNDPTSYSYKKVQRVIGETVTLDELAALGYPAAAIVKKLGIDETQIHELYSKYIERQRQIRDDKARASNKTVGTRRAKNVVEQDVATRLLIQKLNSQDALNIDINAADVKDQIVSTVYHE